MKSKLQNSFFYIVKLKTRVVDLLANLKTNQKQKQKRKKKQQQQQQDKDKTKKWQSSPRQVNLGHIDAQRTL